MARRKILGTFQMLWDCESCGTGKLLGVDHRHCPACGAVQDETRRYLPAQSEAVPTTYNPDPDHECPFCGTPNSRRSNNCVNCGGPMDGSEEVARRPATTSMAAETVEDAVRATQKREEAQRATRVAVLAPGAQEARRRARADEPARNPREGTGRPTTWGTRRDQYKRPVAVGLGVLGVVLAVWAVFFWEKTVEVEVESRYWERVQQIERFKQVREGAWCDSKPHDAYGVSSRRKVHHYETVTDCHSCDCHDERYQSGESCRESCSTNRQPDGAGGYDVVESCHDVCTPQYDTRQICVDRTHEEPVYADYCDYMVDRWRPQRAAWNSGGATTEPAWPELEYKECGSQALGCERPGARSQAYRVTFRDLHDLEHYQCGWPQPEWELYEEGEPYEAVVKILGGRFQCDTVRRTT